MLGNYFHSLIGYLVDRPVDRSLVLKELATNFREIFIVPKGMSVLGPYSC